MSSTTDSTLEETLNNGIKDKKEKPSLQDSSKTDCVANPQLGTNS